MSHSVFICAAFTAAPLVRSMHTTLRARGVTCLSGWADTAGDEPEDLEKHSPEDLYNYWRKNRDGITSADTVIVLADTPMREGHAEAEWARMHGKRIVWVGRPTLTATIADFIRVATPIEAIDNVLAITRRSVTQPAPECERVYVIGNDGHEADDGVPVKCDRPARDGRMCAECATMEAP